MVCVSDERSEQRLYFTCWVPAVRRLLHGRQSELRSTAYSISNKLIRNPQQHLRQHNCAAAVPVLPIFNFQIYISNKIASGGSPSVAAVQAAHEDGHGLVGTARLQRVVRGAVALALPADELAALGGVDAVRRHDLPPRDLVQVAPPRQRGRLGGLHAHLAQLVGGQLVAGEVGQVLGAQCATDHLQTQALCIGVPLSAMILSDILFAWQKYLVLLEVEGKRLGLVDVGLLVARGGEGGVGGRLDVEGQEPADRRIRVQLEARREHLHDLKERRSNCVKG